MSLRVILAANDSWTLRTQTTMYKDEDIRLKLEAMKLTQGSLQQLMTLSAGGLALYFSFISKTPFLDSLRVLGLLVVLSWTTSLCCAAIAHRLHGKLFVCIQNLVETTRRFEMLESTIAQIETRMKTSLDPESLLDQARKKIKDGSGHVDLTMKAFEAAYFPIQDRAIFLVSVALYSFVFGFIFLAGGYVAWTFNV